MRSYSMKCQKQVLKIWEWEISHKNNPSAVHIWRKLNTITEKESQSPHVDTERMLQSKFLNLALKYLFQTRNIFICYQYWYIVQQICRPDPVTMYIDAFNIDQSHLKFYAFLPISVIPRVLSEVK